MIKRVSHFDIQLHLEDDPQTYDEYRNIREKLADTNLKEEIETAIRSILDSADINLAIEVTQIR